MGYLSEPSQDSAFCRRQEEASEHPRRLLGMQQQQDRQQANRKNGKKKWFAALEEEYRRRRRDQIAVEVKLKAAYAQKKASAAISQSQTALVDDTAASEHKRYGENEMDANSRTDCIPKPQNSPCENQQSEQHSSGGDVHEILVAQLINPPERLLLSSPVFVYRPRVCASFKFDEKEIMETQFFRPFYMSS
ncbi:unnamed protein product [Gongylonema pulchrum]|uniref:Uncharacterized protein n=1 Tax=Gongylonema pulchrum TaxID=637853 RepID=A0A183E2H5_9BILA|nr:unnamed protein product [Gongylonema pulchrum]